MGHKLGIYHGDYLHLVTSAYTQNLDIYGYHSSTTVRCPHILGRYQKIRSPEYGTAKYSTGYINVDISWSIPKPHTSPIFWTQSCAMLSMYPMMCIWYDIWQMTDDIYDISYMACLMWYVIYDIRYMIYDVTWHGMTWHIMTCIHDVRHIWFVSIHIMVGFIPPCLLLTCSIMSIIYIYIYVLYIYIVSYIYIILYISYIYIILIYYMCVFFPVLNIASFFFHIQSSPLMAHHHHR